MMLPLTLKDKNYSLYPYNELFAKFKKIIADVNLCVVIGYTFRDSKILDIIRECLQSNLAHFVVGPKGKRCG